MLTLVGNQFTDLCYRDQSDYNVQCLLYNENHPKKYIGCVICKQLQLQRRY